jgi:peptidoglycan hydrolase-like protein with peptidoglycan-binding domain
VSLIEIYPQWRSYSYFVVDEDIIIVDNSHRIVSVVPVGSGGAAQYDSRDSGSAFGVSMTTEEIRRIQVILRERGYSLEVDGIMGPQTREAIIAFQRREGIEATGQIDQRTSAALGVDSKQVGTNGRPAGDRNQAGQQPAADQPGNQPTTTGQDGSTGQDGREGPSRSQQRPENPASGNNSNPAMNNAPPRQGTKDPSDAGRSPATR